MYKILCAVMLSVCLLFAGCRAKRPAVSASSVERQTDSYYEKDVLTPYVVKPDSASILALLACDSLNQVYLKEISTKATPGTTANVLLKNNRLNVAYKTKHDTIRVPSKIIRRTVKSVQTVTVTITKTVNVLHWWQKWLMWAGGILIVIIAFFIGMRWSKIGFVATKLWKLK